MTEDKTRYICEFCSKQYQKKPYYDKHIMKCEIQEIETFNLEGLIEELQDIDPELAESLEIELNNILKTQR